MQRLSLVLPVMLFVLPFSSSVSAQATLSLTGGVNLSTLAADAPSPGDLWHSESLAGMSIGLAATVPRLEVPRGPGWRRLRAEGRSAERVEQPPAGHRAHGARLLRVYAAGRADVAVVVVGALLGSTVRRSHAGRPGVLRLRRVGLARSGARRRRRQLRRGTGRNRRRDGPRGRPGRRRRGWGDGPGRCDRRPALHAWPHPHWRGRTVLERAKAPCSDASGRRSASDRVRVRGRVDHLVAARVQQAVDPPDRVLGASSRPVSVLLRLQVRLEDRRQNQHRRRLRNPVPQAGDAQGTGRSAAFPFLAEGRLPHLMFRGLLGVHSRFGPRGRWASYRLSSSLHDLRFLPLDWILLDRAA